MNTQTHYKLIHLLPLCFLFFCSSLNAQFFNLGQNPSTVKWRQINTDRFQIIFSGDFEASAQHVATVLDYIYEKGMKSMKSEPKKISIILQSQFTNSNGFVSLAPWRSEFFGTPPQDNDALAWLDLLAVHEFRHVLQLQKLNQGFSKVAHILFGEAGTAAIFGLTTPLWFIEGDATLNETTLTSAGRGRRADFEMLYRTFLLERGGYDYDKATFGSFKDYVPTTYPVGYFLNTYLRRHHGVDIASNIYDRVAKRAYQPFAFSRALKKETGLNTVQTYEEMKKELNMLWKDKERATSEQYDITTTETTVPTSYNNLVATQEGIIASKSGFGLIDRFVSITDEGEEKKILVPGLYDNFNLSANKDYLVWSEHVPDPRWYYRDYSVVMRYDLRTKKKKQLTHRSKLFAPSINPSGTQICAVEADAQHRFSLLLLDAETGDLIKRFENKSNAFYKTPRWSEDGSSIVAVKLMDDGYALVILDIESGIERILLPPWRSIVSQPVFHKEHVYFHAGLHGKDNIYAIDLRSSQVYQVTQAKNGAFSPALKDGKLYFSNYTSEGYKVAVTPIDTNQWIPLKNVEDVSIHYYAPVVAQEFGGSVIDSIPEKKFNVSPYKETKHLINPHSWGPVAPDANTFDASIGVFVASQDVLGVATSILAYKQEPRLNAREFSYDLTYAKLFPVFELQASHRKTLDAQYFITENQDTVSSDHISKEIGVAVSLPFNFTQSQYITTLSLSSGVFLQDNRYDLKNTSINYQGLSLINKSGLRFRHLYRKAKRDIINKFGIDFETLYQRSLNETENNSFDGSLFFAKLMLNVPSLFKHHAFSFVGEHQKRNRKSNVSPFGLVRGFPLANGLIKPIDDLQTFTANYHFPIAYPDLKLSFISYIQRIKLAPFFKHYRSLQEGSLNSFGATISADMNLLRYSYLLDIGLRAEYFPEYGRVFTSTTLEVTF